MAIYLASRSPVLDALDWIPTLTVEKFNAILAAVYLFRIANLITLDLLPTQTPGFGIVIAVLAAVGAWRLRHERSSLAIVGLATVTMPVTLIALSLFHPLLLPRYLMWSTGPYFVLAGVAVASLSQRRAALACVALAIGAAVGLAPYYGAETKPRWDLAAIYLAENARPGDAVFANTGAARVMLAAAYGQRNLDPAIITEAPSLNEAAARLAAGNHVWILYGRTGQGWGAPEEGFFEKWRILGTPVQHIVFGRHVFAERFDPMHPKGVPNRDASNE
jgi:hypothetical protein